MTLFTKKENENASEEKINDAKTLGERLSAARKRKGLTQEDFANYLDVTPQAVSKWENNLSCPDILILPKISEILGVGIEELLTGETKRKEAPKRTVTDQTKQSGPSASWDYGHRIRQATCSRHSARHRKVRCAWHVPPSSGRPPRSSTAPRRHRA